MKRTLISTLLVTALAALPAQAQDEVPPNLRIINWEVARLPTAELFNFCDMAFVMPCTDGPVGDALAFQHEELDVILIRIRIEDFDWTAALAELNLEMPAMGEAPPEPPDYEGVFIQVFLTDLGIGTPTPAIIPSIGASWPADLGGGFFSTQAVGSYFGLENEQMDGFTPTQEFTFGSAGPPYTEIEIALQVPDFLGQNQDRLDPSIGALFDVAYGIVVDASNDTDPGNGLFNVPLTVSRIFSSFGAIQSPALAAPNPQAVPDAAASATLVESGTQVTLDGSRTVDSTNTGLNPDDPTIFEKDTLTYVWEWLSGPVRVDPVQTSTGDPMATVVLNTPTAADGSDPYVFRLLVDDGFNAVPNAATVSINVVADLPVNQPPTVSIIGPGAPVLVGDTITLDGSGSADPDGDTLKYRWTQTNALGGELEQAEITDTFQPLSGLNESITQWQALTSGRFYFRLLVSDNGFTTSTRFTVDVIDPVVNGTQFVSTDIAATANSLRGNDQASADDAADATPSANDLVGPRCGLGLLPLGFAPFGLIALRRRR